MKARSNGVQYIEIRVEDGDLQALRQELNDIEYPARYPKTIELLKMLTEEDEASETTSKD